MALGEPWLQASMPANKNCAAGTWPWGNLGCRHRCLLVKTVLQAPYPVWAFKDLKRGRAGVGVPGEHTLSIVIKTSLQTVCHHGGGATGLAMRGRHDIK